MGDGEARLALSARLEQFRILIAELDAVRGDNQRHQEIMDKIRREARAFRETLATHDGKTKGRRR